MFTDLVYNFDFDIAAWVLDFMLLLLVFLRKNLPSRAMTAYKFLLVSNFLAVTFDITTVFTISHPELFSEFTLYFTNICYYFFHNLTNFLFVMYSLIIERYKFDKPGVRVFWVILAVIVLGSIVSTPVTGWAFTFDENLHYSSGPFLYFYYFMAVFSIIYVLVIKISFKSQKTIFQIVSHFAFLLLLGAAFTVHLFFFNDYLIELFGISLGLLVLYISQDNSDAYRYKGMSVFNYLAFSNTLQNKIDEQNKFAIVMVNVKRSEEFSYSKNSRILFTMEKYFSHTIVQEIKFSRAPLFALNDMFFCFFCEPEHALRIIEKIRDRYKTPILIDGQQYRLELNFAMMQHPGLAEDYSEALQMVDGLVDRMYDYEGVDILEPTRDDIMDERYWEILDCLKDSIENNSIEVQYQPIFDNKNVNGLNVEAQIILRDKAGKIIPISEFLPIAERSGCVYELDRIKLLKISEFINHSDIAKSGIQYVNMNFSSTTMMDEMFFKKLKTFIREYFIPCRRINLEYIDNGLTQNEEVLRKHIEILKKHGFHLTLDGYGKCHNDSQYLLHYNFDDVKIDKTLVDALSNDSEYSQKFMVSTIKMLKSLDKRVYCEGVSTKEQYDFLRNTDCDFIQGDVIGSLMTEDQYLVFADVQLKNNLDFSFRN